MGTRLGCLLAALTVVTASPAVAQDDQWSKVVHAQINAVIEKKGLRLSHDVEVRSLAPGQYAIQNLDLKASVWYQILGACDLDCEDLDLKLFDENWNLVDEDVAQDDVPVLQVTPIRTAQFHIIVLMRSCSVSPCRYGVGVLTE